MHCSTICPAVQAWAHKSCQRSEKPRKTAPKFPKIYNRPQIWRNYTVLPIETFVAIGIGAALFFVLGRFVAIPSPVPNTNISLQYAVLGLLAAMYGPVAGGLIGFIGHALIDLSWGGIPWWSWVIASAFTGVVVGLFAKKLNLQEGDFNKRKVITYTISNVIAHLIAWIVVAPVLDILIYAEPVKKVFAQGAFAAISNIITAVVVGGLLVLAYTKTIAKKGSLDKE